MDTTFNCNETEKAFLQKAKRINERLKQQMETEMVQGIPFVEQIPEKVLTTYEEARKTTSTQHISPYGSIKSNTLYFKGDVYINGNLDDNWIDEQLKGYLWEGDLHCFLIDGDLIVNGNITINYIIEFSVVKNLKCHYVFNFQAFVAVYGTAAIKFGIFGMRTEGCFDVFGKLETPYIICDDHSMTNKSISEFVYLEGHNFCPKNEIELYDTLLDEPRWNWLCLEKGHRFFVPSIWTEENCFSVERFFDFVKTGENPFITIA